MIDKEQPSSSLSNDSKIMACMRRKGMKKRKGQQVEDSKKGKYSKRGKESKERKARKGQGRKRMKGQQRKEGKVRMARKGRKGLPGKNSKDRTDFHIRSNIFLYLQGRYRPIFSDQIWWCSSNMILIIVISYILTIVPLDSEVRMTRKGRKGQHVEDSKEGKYI